LPTEAQWEFACRAGTTTRFWTGDDALGLRQAEWNEDPDGREPHLVGQRAANPFGLHDLLGNLAELVQDTWGPNPAAELRGEVDIDPLGTPGYSTQRVVRGGWWGSASLGNRSAGRSRMTTNLPQSYIGFRLALPIDGVRRGVGEAPGLNAALRPHRELAEWVLSLPEPRRVEFSYHVSSATRVDEIPPWDIEVSAVTIGAGEHLTDDDFLRFASIRTLRKLSISSATGRFPKITDRGIENLAKSPVQHSLVELRFQGWLDNVSDAAVASLNRLSPLHVCEFPAAVTDAGWRQLDLPELKSLSIEGAPLGDIGCAHLANLPVLRVLVAARTPITSTGLQSLASSPTLEVVDVHGCPHLTSEDVLQFRVARPRCQVVSDLPPAADLNWHGWPADAPSPAIAPFTAEQAAVSQSAWAAYLQVPVEFTNSLGMKFRLIPPGEFQMGSTIHQLTDSVSLSREPGEWQAHLVAEMPQHRVILTRPFFLAVHETTQAQYRQIMNDNPSLFVPAEPGADGSPPISPNHPVESVAWLQAAEFCEKLSRQESLSPRYQVVQDQFSLDEAGVGYRLATEAEWEFACRAGTTTKYWVGD
ncbi:MAG: hypothetical protein EHM42_12295, partial [Planctomycetaceae bacterium]